MMQRNKIIKYVSVVTFLFIGFVIINNLKKTEKFEEDTSSVIGKLKDTIDGILSRPPADNIEQDAMDDEDDEEDDMLLGSA